MRTPLLTQSEDLRLVSSGSRPDHDEVDRTPDMVRIGITVPAGQKLLVNKDSDADQMIAAFVFEARHHGQQHAVLGASNDAFRGALHLIDLGLLSRNVELPGGSMSWAQMLVLHGQEPLLPEYGLCLEARFRMLKDTGIDLEPALSLAIAESKTDTFLPLLKAGASPQTTHNRNNALHVAARSDSSTLETLHALMDKGVDIAAPDKSRNSPFQLLAEHRPDLMRALHESAKNEQGAPNAQLIIGLAHLYGCGVDKNVQEAVKWIREAAQQGHAHAQNKLGFMHKDGSGVEQNYQEAVNWYRKAAEQGHARAQYNLGDSYSWGSGVKENHQEAVKWYRKAAEQGYAEAEYKLGFSYELGRGVKKNYQEAVKWYRKAAEQGDAGAQYSLGTMYENGWGVKENHQEAVKWYRKAAEQGYAEAQNSLGLSYAYGRGVQQNSQEAVKWFSVKAEQGDVHAQILLGYRYQCGLGVEQNYQEAEKWYRKAVEQGHEFSRSYLAEVRIELAKMYGSGRAV